MIPSWYDVLGVDETATTDEIRAAWQEAVAGLDPTDRRFKQRNRAAEVLLDPERRADHDAELAAQEPEDEPDGLDAGDDVDEIAVEHAARGRDHHDVATAGATVVLEEQSTGATRVVDEPSAAKGDEDDGDHGDGHRRRRWLVPALAALALLLVVTTVLALVLGGSGDDDGLPDAREIEAARAAAEAAIVPIVSYDYRDLEKSRADALAYLTPDYAEEYEENFEAVIAENAPRTKTIVTAEVVSSAIVRTGEGLVDVLVFVDRPTRNVQRDVVAKDQATVRMRDVDGRWLVDCLVTTGGSCED